VRVAQVEQRQNIHKARSLRKSTTHTEQLLWEELRNRRLAGYKFRRQVPISGYIVDPVCLEKGLVVELDGGQHADYKQEEYDDLRSVVLKRNGLRVLRFWNNQVWKNREDVLAEILRHLNDHPHPSPLPLAREGARRADEGGGLKILLNVAGSNQASEIVGSAAAV